jgi:hypothetical protein
MKEPENCTGRHRRQDLICFNKYGGGAIIGLGKEILLTELFGTNLNFSTSFGSIAANPNLTKKHWILD